MASRRGSFVAPALLFVALLGGALFFGVLAMSGKNETGIATDNAAVTDPSPSKTAPAAKTIATTRPSVTATPPATGRPGSPGATTRTGSVSVETRTVISPPHKPIPGRTEAAIAGDYCAPAGAKALSETGDHLICKPTTDNAKNLWDDQN